MKRFLVPWMAPVLTVLGAVALTAAAPTSREVLLNAMRERPGDPWPRGEGHVLLGEPGTPEEYKAYLEPGGSFSPSFGSFGVSIWVLDDQQRVVATSDNLRPEELVQRFVWADKPAWPVRSELPSLQTRTAYYDATWSSAGLARWQLQLRTRGLHQIWLMIRSPGPAGARLKSLHRYNNRLYISDRWLMTFNPPANDSEVVPPGGPDPLLSPAGNVSWRGESTWGYARFKLLPNQEYFVTIDDSQSPPDHPLNVARVRPPLRMDLPDARFADALNAQAAHLMMGLVYNETRPGDPNNYPLNWLRDGAYVIVALARAGLLDTAGKLCQPFAEQDFFGGFGAEADGPGLALWAIDEVSSQFSDPKYDQWLWPHVRRKAALIEELLDATGPIRKPYQGPIVPKHQNRDDLDLVCEAGKDGLITGKMDWHRPVLYVNAASYRGLMGAVHVARRLKRFEDASRWFERAAKLRTDWNRVFDSGAHDNERNYICGLHPMWVVQDRAGYESRLEARWQAAQDARDRTGPLPEWTYFSVAEAHQWLALGQPQKTWAELHWFWDHQASPGLYTWWEGSGEENTFHRWEHVRGWVNPKHVTPHYWTAAEMLLLQLDMLGCLDESGNTPVLIVGAGVPSQWLAERMSVTGLSTRIGKIDWDWNGKRMKVSLNGAPCRVRLGPAFPMGTQVIVKP